MKINTYAVNCNDAWLNTDGDDISGSYVKYKDHQEVVSALEAKCAALAAKGMEVVREASLIYSKYNDTQMPDRDIVDQQTLQELYEICTADGDNAAFLAEVRAQGVEMVIAYHHERSDALAEVDRNGSFRHHSAAIDATDVLMQIRQETAHD